MRDCVSAAVKTAPDPLLAPRRTVFAALVVATIAAMLVLAALALAPGGLGAVDLILIWLFALTLPWQVIGFWNAAIGFLIMRFARDPVAAVLPAAARVTGAEPITASTAILLCIRNEMPERAARHLEPLLAGLAGSGFAAQFHIYVLSDTDDCAIAAQEEARFDAMAAEWSGSVAFTYRRRALNRGFKAGNIEEFCDRWGARHDLAVTLDADSIMPAAAVLKMVRIMQAAPEIGILQGLVIGAPSKSAFARVFQFGMRLGMRSYTIGSAWWQADCGPYWGHNGVLRLAPFMAHCRLPQLAAKGPLGGAILSHDQIEAVLMRRAGFEVRVLPQEDLGFEENPPTLIEFLRRDQRWCQGNMQYLGFLDLPGLRPVSRYQLVFAILMFVGSPAWIGLFTLATLALAAAPTPGEFIAPGAGLAVFVCVLAMWFAPKIATVIDILSRRAARRAFGGGLRFAAGVAVETVFTLLLLPIMWLRHTVVMAGLLFGRTIDWKTQVRDGHAVAWADAARDLWPQTVLGLAALALLAATHPAAIPYALLIAGGLALAIPFAVVTSSSISGEILAATGIGRLPEETAPPDVLRAMAGMTQYVAAASPRA